MFLVFAASRVYLQWRRGRIDLKSFLFWLFVFCSAMVGIIRPDLTTGLARLVGIGRGADAVIYLSVTILFYLLFRLYIYVEDLRHEMSDIISQLALKEDKKHVTKKK
jgi:hypothetical protein